MRRLWRSVAAGGFSVAYTGLLSPVVMGLSVVDERAPDPVLHAWGRDILKACGVRTRATGLEHLPPGNFVLACNHQSNFDPLVLFAHIRRHLRFVAKAQLLGVPVLGRALKSAGNIFVDRQGTSADRALLQGSVTAVRERVSICFFAEGTRSHDGVLRPFKKGAAIMALEAQVPLVPAAIAGTYGILHKGSALPRPHPAALCIGTPIRTEGLTAADRESVTQQAHAQVVQLLAQGNRLVSEMQHGH